MVARAARPLAPGAGRAAGGRLRADGRRPGGRRGVARGPTRPAHGAPRRGPMVCMRSARLNALQSNRPDDSMAMITVRKLPDEVHRALRVRAARHGRSTEAEVRQILSDAVRPRERLRMGDALAALGRRAGLTDADLRVVEGARDRTPARPPGFE